MADRGGAVEFAFEEALDLVDARLLVLVHPANAVVSRDRTDIRGDLRVARRKFEVLIEDRDYILLVFERASQLFVHPVVARRVAQQPVERVRRQHQNEVLRGLNVFQKGGVEFSGVQFVDVNKHLNL